MVSPLRRVPLANAGVPAQPKGTKGLAPAPGPSPRLGVSSLRHSSGDTALRLASLHLHAACSTTSNGATRHSPDEHLHSACRWGGWIKIKSRRADTRPAWWVYAVPCGSWLVGSPYRSDGGLAADLILAGLPNPLWERSLLAKVVNDNASSQMLSGARGFFASRLAPTVDRVNPR
jgi:hypothetical protein